MSVGTPVIATPIGMVPYLITERETGFIAKTDEEFYILNQKANLRVICSSCNSKKFTDDPDLLDFVVALTFQD